MKDFFQTIILVSLFTGLIVMYFLIRELISRYQDKKNARRQNRAQTEKKLKENSVFFSALIDKIQTGELLWFEVTSKDKQIRMLIQKAALGSGWSVSFVPGGKALEIDLRLPKPKQAVSGTMEYGMNVEFSSRNKLIQLYTALFNSQELFPLNFTY